MIAITRADRSHPFFNAMVLMGGTIALGGCGGETGDTGQSRSGNGSGGKPPGDEPDHVDDLPTGGAMFNSGGSTSASSGGAIAAGGLPIGTGGLRIGTGGTGGTTSAGPDGGLAALLACTANQVVCVSTPRCSVGGDVGLELPGDCRCDVKRPKTLECAANEIRACRVATALPNDIRLARPLEFDCRCVPAGATCQEQCQETFGTERYYQCPEEMPADRLLCGCARVYLR